METEKMIQKNENRAEYNEKCLYFVANSLGRTITEMTEKAFADTGFSPSYGHLLLLIIEEPHHTQAELAKRTNLKSSTMTRFLEKLEEQGFISRKHSGRICTVEATKTGAKQKEIILNALKKLFNTYCEILGEELAVKLTKEMFEADKKMLNAN